MQALLDTGGRAGDLPGHESLSPPRRLVIEKDPVASEHAVGLPVVHRLPIAEHLGASVRAAGMERGLLGLRRLRHLAVHLAARSLVKLGAVARRTQRLQQLQRPHRTDLHRVYRHVETDAHVRLGSQVIHLVGHNLLHQAGKRRAVGQVAIVQKHPRVLQVRVLVERLDPRRIETARAADQAVDLVPLGQQ